MTNVQHDDKLQARFALRLLIDKLGVQAVVDGLDMAIDESDPELYERVGVLLRGLATRVDNELFTRRDMIENPD